MKKVLFTMMAITAFAALTGCSKTYTCECVVSYSGTGAPTTTQTTTTTITDSKSKAQEACDKGDASTTTVGITQKVECTLK
ncbi:MAG: hypothetical protein ACKVTZ_18310 [Bacteroidia bacterium]